MRLTPQEPDIPETGGFTDANDLFGYRDFADRLANLVGNIDEPLAIVLDGQWGSGKSVFVKQWAGLLRKRGAVVIYFDAFANDHYEDAFLAVSAEIHATAKRLLADKDGIKRRYFDKAKKVAMVLTPIALQVGARVLTAGAGSLEDFEAGGEAIKAAAKAIGDEAEKAVERLVSERLRKASEERATLTAFRETLSQLASALSQQQAKDGEAFPLIFIVDELDRCRPPFAVDMIERIKHLFSVPGVCFILVTHLTELEHAVQGAYGIIDAPAYLEKFYQLRVLLPRDTGHRPPTPSAYVAHLWNALQLVFHISGAHIAVRQDIQALAEAHDLSLRRVERVMTHVALVGAAVGPNLAFVPTLAAGLCVMRQEDPTLYHKARIGDLSWSDTQSFLQPSGGRGIKDKDSIIWWKYVTGGGLSSEETASVEKIIRRFNLDEPRDLLTAMTRYIDELLPTR